VYTNVFVYTVVFVYPTVSVYTIFMNDLLSVQMTTDILMNADVQSLCKALVPVKSVSMCGWKQQGRDSPYSMT